MFFRILLAALFVTAAGSLHAAAPKLRLIDMSFNILTAVGTSTWDNGDISLLQGGGHDPNRRGFTFQQGEFSLSGAVDPFFRGEAHIVFLENLVELEEAFGVTTALPGGFQVKAGHFFAGFGRVNAVHPHAWTWQDQPVINSRIFGPDGFRAPGAQLAWLAPTPWFLEFTAAAHQGDGEFAGSFTGPWHGFVPGVGGGGHDHGEEEGGEQNGNVVLEIKDDMGNDIDIDTGIALNSLGFNGRPIIPRPGNANPVIGFFRMINAFNLAGVETQWGASLAWGDNTAGNKTAIYGADAVIKWVAEDNQKGYPFVTLEGEFTNRHFQAPPFHAHAEYDDASGTAQVLDIDIGDQVIKDYGVTTSLLWGFKPGWALGLRSEWASGSGDGVHELSIEEDSRWEDPGRQDRVRISPLLSWRPSEFSRIRLQYNHDFRSVKEGDTTGHTVWLGCEILWGFHPAHKF